MKVEVREEDPLELSRESRENWHDFRIYHPTVKYLTSPKGDYCGRYQCIVERPAKLSYFGEIVEGVDRTLELCYWNSLSHKFQDKDNKFVTVAFWCQIPELPRYKAIDVPREKMLETIAGGQWKELYKCSESDEYYNPVHTHSLNIHHVSYFEELFISIKLNDNNILDYLYAVINPRYKKPNE